jgi:hypothetical protein
MMVNKLSAAILLLIGSAQIAQATTVTVQELSTNPNKIVNIQVTGFYSGYAYAGVVNMLVDGVQTQGFCIDPFHFSSHNPLPYEVVPLADAPKQLVNVFPEGGMGETKADKIARLWAMAYLPNSPTWGGAAAAALQIAIWEIVADNKFSVSGNDYGASALLTQLDSYTGPKANLVALTGPGQDYVIATPDGGATLLMLSLASGALLVTRRFRS